MNGACLKKQLMYCGFALVVIVILYEELGREEIEIGAITGIRVNEIIPIGAWAESSDILLRITDTGYSANRTVIRGFPVVTKCARHTG